MEKDDILELKKLELFEKYRKGLEKVLRQYNAIETYIKLSKVLNVEREKLALELLRRGIEPELFAQFLSNPDEIIEQISKNHSLYKALDKAAYHLVSILLRSLAYASPKKAFLLIANFLSSYLSYKYFSK